MCRPVVVCAIFMFLLSGGLTFTLLQKEIRFIARFSDDSDNSLTRNTEERIQGHKLHAKLFEEISDFPRGRQKRALISFGQWATKFLLRGARLVKSTKFEDTYIKPGGYKRALDDFDSLKPVNVDKIGHVKRGEVGDKSLTVFPSYDFIPPFMVVVRKHNFEMEAGDFFKRKVILYGDYVEIIKYLQREFE